MQSNEAPIQRSSIPRAEMPPENPFGEHHQEDRDTAKFGTEESHNEIKAKKHKLVMGADKRNGKVNQEVLTRNSSYTMKTHTQT